MLLEYFQRHDLENALVCRCQHDRRGRPVVMGPQPIASGDTPAIARDQAGKLKLWHRSDEVVADTALVLEKAAGHDGTDGVATDVPSVGITRPIPEEPGRGVESTGLKFLTEHILISIDPSIARPVASGCVPSHDPTRCWVRCHTPRRSACWKSGRLDGGCRSSDLREQLEEGVAIGFELLGADTADAQELGLV